MPGSTPSSATAGRAIAVALLLPCLPTIAHGQDAGPRDDARPAAQVQAGFFTPRRTGQMWDTWLYHHDGRYFQFYLAGTFNRWDGHELAISDDGVHWTEHGVLLAPRPGVTWMGTGHIWKSPAPDRPHTWLMNYSEWFGDKQDIMFAESNDLLHWQKVDEKHRFVQDGRWYKEKGRWDCIDTIERPAGGLYGYFTADPDPAKVTHACCGFGFAESLDGVNWKALPPVAGDVSGEFGGIHKIGSKYYILLSEGRVAVGEQPTGPFRAQPKNPNAFGAGCDIYFPRFFHNAPDGPLVNHFYTKGPVFSAPLKAVEVDADDVLRLTWWPGNEKLKDHRLTTTLTGDAAGPATVRMLDQPLPLDRVHVVEGDLGPTQALPAGGGPADTVRQGIYLDSDDGTGAFLVVRPDSTTFGRMKPDGSDAKVLQTIDRGLPFGPSPAFRLVVKHDMMELYVDDYLMNLKRFQWNGRLGVIGAAGRWPTRLDVWQSR